MEIRTNAYPGDRFVVCNNPMLADYPQSNCAGMLATTEKKLAKIAREVARRSRTRLPPLDTAQNVGRIKDHYKVAKHFELLLKTDASHMPSGLRPLSASNNWITSTSSAPVSLYYRMHHLGSYDRRRRLLHEEVA